MKFWAFLLVAATAFAADATVVELIVAKVNGDIITKTELGRKRKQMEASMAANGATPKQIEEIMLQREKDTLRERIDELLLIQRAKELSINVDGEVAKYLSDMQQKQKIADPDKFQQFIRDNSGMTYEDYKAEIRNSMMTQRIVGQEVYSKINLPRTDLQKYYEEHKAEYIRQEQVFLREIVISTEGKDAAGVAAAEKKAKDVVARARKGERFGDLVRDNSDSPTARDGGNLGAFKKTDLRDDLVAQIWDKPKGHVTEPIKGPTGFVVFRIEEHFKEGQASFEEVEQEIKEKLFSPMVEPRIREFLTQLRYDSFVEIRDGFVDTGAAPGKDTRWNDPAMLKPVTVSKEEVAAQSRRKKFLGIPVPGTKASSEGKSTSR